VKSPTLVGEERVVQGESASPGKRVGQRDKPTQWATVRSFNESQGSRCGNRCRPLRGLELAALNVPGLADSPWATRLSLSTWATPTFPGWGFEHSKCPNSSHRYVVFTIMRCNNNTI